MYPHKITCALCDEKIKSSYILCLKCHRQYHMHMHEEWFLEMVKLQRQQDVIDQKESGNLVTEIQIHNEDKVYKGKRVGRPAKEYKMITILLQIFDKNVENVANKTEKRLSLRQIQSLLKQQGYHAVPNTIKNILRKYRKDAYKRFVQKIT